MSLPKNKSLPEKGKILALDLGRVRTGVAISDAHQRVGFPRDEITGSGTTLIFKLKALIHEEGVAGIIVGFPLDLQGNETQQTQWTQSVINELSKEIDIPITKMDERWSTKEARKQQGSGQPCDSESALLLLQNYLGTKA